MLNKLIIIVPCVALLLSCAPSGGKAIEELSRDGCASFNNDRFITFYNDKVHIASYEYKNSADINVYKADKPAFLASGKTRYGFIGLNGDVLMIREKAGSTSSPVRFIDLKAKKDLLKKGFFSTATFSQEAEKEVVLKKVGDRLNEQQLPLLKTTIQNMEEYAQNLAKSGLAMEFYQKYKFDFETKSLVEVNEIIPVLYRRNVLM